MTEPIKPMSFEELLACYDDYDPENIRGCLLILKEFQGSSDEPVFNNIHEWRKFLGTKQIPRFQRRKRCWECKPSPAFDGCSPPTATHCVRCGAELYVVPEKEPCRE